MRTSIGVMRDQILKIWSAMGRVQKISVVAVVAVAVIALGVFVVISSRPTYTTVFSNLGATDAGAIVAKLKQDKVPYEIANGGSTIKVPQAQADTVRLSVASAGLPQSGVVGYEIFDKTNFSSTDFNNQVNLLRALEGELDRTLERLDGVQSANVHLVTPPQALFQQQQAPTTAAVSLQLKPGATLTPSQTQAVVKLVSASVQGLQPANVTVVDQNGNILSDQLSQANNSQQAAQKLTQEQMQIQRQYETGLQTDLQNMLDRVLGPGQSVVKVNAQLNWDQFQSTSELFSPGNRPSVVRSQRQITENFQGTGTPPIGGVPGTQSNVPTYQGAVSGSGPSQYSKTDNTQNYEISKSIEQLAKAPGGIQRLTVAAMVNTPLNQAGVDNLTRTLQAAAGYDANRGDVVTVTSLAFSNQAAQSAADALAAQQRQDLIRRVIEAIGIPLVALVLLFFFRSLVMSLRPMEMELLPVPLTVGELAGDALSPLTPEEEAAIAEAEAAAAAGMSPEAAAALATTGAAAALSGELTAEEVLARAAERVAQEEAAMADSEQQLLIEEEEAQPADPEAERRRRVIEERLKNLARQKPDVVARLLEGWIEERR
ncbi:MAG TPA: flagellar basal-body MS-ring/collar protein FliF [Chloroflexota bacterium]|nr:flagellar basal-body MS-ring/collar protein FliF [Chloroflexota bacterium]